MDQRHWILERYLSDGSFIQNVKSWVQLEIYGESQHQVSS